VFRLKLTRIRDTRHTRATAAAVLIQALARGYCARYNAAASLSDRSQQHSEQRALRTLQRCYRGYRARCSTRQLALARTTAAWSSEQWSAAIAAAGAPQRQWHGLQEHAISSDGVGVGRALFWCDNGSAASCCCVQPAVWAAADAEELSEIGHKRVYGHTRRDERAAVRVQVRQYAYLKHLY
jgi:IQ calmodulin-binding motif